MSRLWRIECLNDNRYEYVRSATRPTVCPLDNGPLGMVKEIGTIEIVKIQEEDIATGGNAQMSSRKIDIDALSSVQTNDLPSLPIDTNVRNLSYVSTADHEGDMFEIHVNPDTPIGNITTDITSSTTVIPVDSDVMEKIMVGFFVKLSDGSNTDDLGRCIAVDAENSQITVETPTTNSFSTSPPTDVQMTVKMIETWHIGPPAHFKIGTDKFTSSFIPANSNIRIVYHNNDRNAKKFILYFEYTH